MTLVIILSSQLHPVSHPSISSHVWENSSPIWSLVSRGVRCSSLKPSSIAEGLPVARPHDFASATVDQCDETEGPFDETAKIHDLAEWPRHHFVYRSLSEFIAVYRKA